MSYAHALVLVRIKLEMSHATCKYLLNNSIKDLVIKFYCYCTYNSKVYQEIKANLPFPNVYTYVAS